MAYRLVDIFRRSGDAHVGRTLVRLAQLAQSVHMHGATHGLPERDREDRLRGNGLDSSTQAHHCATDGDQPVTTVYMEVEQ